MTENKQHEVRIDPQDLSRMYTTSHHVLSVLSFQLTCSTISFFIREQGGRTHADSPEDIAGPKLPN